LDEDVGQILAVGDGQGIGDGREAAEPLGRQLGRFRLVQQDGDRDLLARRAGAENAGRMVAAFGLEAKTLEERVAPLADDASRLFGARGPVLAPFRRLGNAVRQLVRGQEALPGEQSFLPAAPRAASGGKAGD
jgi:hypothetical protein